ncbi:MAG: error-prone DNA polymerase [Gammaproteobacteria bacterium]|nr:error-prone DNA polymerase [Gammaproteobacteria bacterium]
MYAELHAISNFSFLRGASRPEELVATAHVLGYRALALTDECSLAGVVRAHIPARDLGFQLIIGSELKLIDGLRLILLAPDRVAYGDLSELITQGRRGADKGEYRLSCNDVMALAARCLALWLADDSSEVTHGAWLRDVFADRAWVVFESRLDGRDRERLEQLRRLGRSLQLPLVAAGNVQMHRRERRPLHDTLAAIRLGVPLANVGHQLAANAEHSLRRQQRLAALYPPELLAETLVVADRCRFSLTELRYEYPEELVPAGETPTSWLRTLTERGIRWRWPAGESVKVRGLIENELSIIRDLRYEPFFLTVYDVVHFARRRQILCQGRGSSANSAVCYVLGITEVDPAKMEVLFERFLSRERNEPPDIDVDFEHERREEVIQYVYEKYGRDRAALAATVISYRTRSAIRDVGKALGFDLEQVDRLAKNLQWWDGRKLEPERLLEAGFDPSNPKLQLLGGLVRTLVGFPRHLSQHVGGFVIARDKLSRLVPIENASMPGRTVIQWDKDDLDALGLLKVDCLALGMLTAIRKSFDLIAQYSGRRWTIDSLPPEDPKVYKMISNADTVGVFQIESRAQMSMLPRLRPQKFYDLVVEVAIVRPGPIQGKMVHPYLRRRQKLEPVDYPSPEVEDVLGRTLGVPIFQEQVIKLATVAAGFTPGEADQLRRSMATFRHRGGVETFERKLIDGMRQRGYPEEYARRIFDQILGFGDYGFPESHAASFALLVYVSSWIKRYEPAAFLAALLNSQPMGFYAPPQLVQDARRHDVEVRPVDVRISDWDCTLEQTDRGPAVRLGLRMVSGLSPVAAARVVQRRCEAVFTQVEDLARRADLNRRELNALANADALRGLAAHRHHAHWAVAGVEASSPLLEKTPITEALPLLPVPTEGDNIVADYDSIGLTLRRHPLALLRPRLAADGWRTAAESRAVAHGDPIRIAGIVVSRQHPSSAKGVIFVTIEDETGHSNLVIWKSVSTRQRRELLQSRLFGVIGTLQREGEVQHVVARRLVDLTLLLGKLKTESRDFH